MLSLTQIAVAGCVVALFGSFVLAGVLSQPRGESVPVAGASASAQADPSERSAEPEPVTEAVDAWSSFDLLPGVDLVAEEVEPGVYRVVSDGVRDLTRMAARESVPPMSGGGSRALVTGRVVAGLDGSVWATWPDGLFRLGQEATHAWDRPQMEPGRVTDIEVGPEGTLWLVRNRQLLSFDGDTWRIHKQLPRSQQVRGVEVQADGMVWAAWENGLGGKTAVLRRSNEGWDVIAQVPGPDLISLAVVAEPRGDLWVLPGFFTLRRHGGDGWAPAHAPAGGQIEMDAGPDGTVWIRLHDDCGPGSPGTELHGDASAWSGWGSCGGPSSALARLKDGEWTRYDESDGLPMMEGYFEVAPDGRVWVNSLDRADNPLSWGNCQGIASFDGDTIRHYLADHCIYDEDISPSGDVWVLAGPAEADGSSTGDPISTYVITPRAWLESEPNPQ